MKEFKIRKMFDASVHLRQDDTSILKTVIIPTAKICKHAVVMPDTSTPTVSYNDIVWYRNQILSFATQYPDFYPLMMMQMRSDCTTHDIRSAKLANAIGTHVYPKEITAYNKKELNEETLKTPPQNLLDCWEEQSNNGMVSSWHCEMPNSFIMDGEKDFLPFVKWLSDQYPKLKIILQNISTAIAVDFVINNNPHGNIAATITYHHLTLTLDDLLKDNLRPHNYCKPIVKTPEDKKALVNVVLSGHPNFFLGSDSTPHMIQAKECDLAYAGIYSTPVLAQGLVDFFESHDALDKMENFTSVFGSKFYGLPLSEEYITLTHKTHTMIAPIKGIIPFKSGKIFNWYLE